MYDVIGCRQADQRVTSLSPTGYMHGSMGNVPPPPGYQQGGFNQGAYGQGGGQFGNFRGAQAQGAGKDAGNKGIGKMASGRLLSSVVKVIEAVLRKVCVY